MHPIVGFRVCHVYCVAAADVVAVATEFSLQDILINLKHPIRCESQTHPQDDHVDRISDCSSRYGQAPAVCTRVRLTKGR